MFRDEEEILQSSGDPLRFYDDIVAPYKGALEEWYVANRGPGTYLLVIGITLGRSSPVSRSLGGIQGTSKATAPTLGRSTRPNLSVVGAAPQHIPSDAERVALHQNGGDPAGVASDRNCCQIRIVAFLAHLFSPGMPSKNHAFVG